MPLLSPLGALIKKHLLALETYHAETVSVDNYVLMPDHLHLCFFIKQTTRRTPLQLLQTLLLFAEKEARETLGIDKLWALPGDLWICYNTEMYRQKKAYTRGNIARWHMDHDEEARLLTHPHLISHPRLDPAYHWEAYGNLILLNRKKLLPCYISSKATPHAITTFTRLACHMAAEGWALVGGFVSEAERHLLATVRAQTPTVKVIQVSAMRLTLDKRPAHLAETLYHRHFLRLTSSEETTCTRAICVWHNLWAETLCGDWRTALIRHFHRRATPPEKQRNLQTFLTHWPSPSPHRYNGPRPLPTTMP